MAFLATYLGSSGWIFQFGELRVLVDPWLRGSLSFPPGRWLIEGKLNNEIEQPKDINLLLLTQGLADHSHKPSLEILPRSIPVIGSISAAKIADSLGFENVSGMRPGEIYEFNELKIEATAGAYVPSVENGYILNHCLGSLYIEPHGFFDGNVGPQKLDALITPVVNLRLPFAGNFIKGKAVLPKLVKAFSPKTVLASTTGGESTFTGLLNQFITVEGDPYEVQEKLGSKIDFINPTVGLPYKLGEN